MANTTQIAHWLLDDITNKITTYANDKAEIMAHMIGPVAVCLLTIYVLLWGAGIASGQITEPFTDGMKRICRICAIVSFGLTVSIYHDSVATFFETIPATMATQMAAAKSGSSGSAASISDVLDQSLQKGIDIGEKSWEMGDKIAATPLSISASIAATPYYLLAIAIDLACALIVAVGAAILFIAFIATALLLAIGPLFIMLAIFPQTQRFFESWLGQVVNFSLLYLLIAVTIGMTFEMFDQFLGDVAMGDINDIVVSAIKVIGAVIAIVAVMLQTRSIAAGLGGGLALQAQGLAGRLASAGTNVARAGMTGNSRDQMGRGLSERFNGERPLTAARQAVTSRVRRAFKTSNSASEGTP
ncbi:MAG: type IV secretion system protein [Nitrospira sp.]|nr:type IV secretion system protein [Nitrospira sp.]MBS0194375.1 type IV secretion system protein [Pseudomonadota bacterium]